MPVLKSGSRPPWVGLAAAVWVQIAAGNAYTFPLYSHSLKSVLGFNQQQLTMLGVANDIGENIGLLPGTACNSFPPWAILSIGTIACFFGYGLLWLSVSQMVSLPYWVLWIALCIATNSSAWLGTGVLVTNMRNFPLSRGTVAGILKGYVGLSAAVLTEIYSGVLKNSSSKLLLFLALGIPALCLAMMYFVRPCTPVLEEDSADNVYFLFIQGASIFLGIYLLTTTILDDVLGLSTTISYIFFCIMVLLLLAPLAIPLKMTLYPLNRKKTGALSQSTSAEHLISGELDSDKSEPLLNPSSSTPNLGNFQEGDDASDVSMLLAEGEGAVKKKRRPKRGEDFEFFEAFIKADFWLLFLVYFLGVGSGVTVLNNLAQIGIAEGINDTTVLLSLFSFCNFVGRLGGGVVSEYFVRSKNIPRTIWMTYTQIIMIVVYLLFASFLNGTLYIATALLGICYGVQFSAMVPTASELFGLKHFGIIYNFMSIGNPLGALLFSGVLAGYIYDQEVERQNGGLTLGSSTSCIGPNCFRLTFLVLAGVCGLGSVLSIILTARIRPVYQMLYSGSSFRLPQSPRC
ncbi:protein NUCLEAR FUSION DEFECTIVE 4-like [Magnolia sinica]|uniref:protein NUCLEAR FUSION DEFECTIVE 4-like n=1 Tax=Magnolia sinica TaxID=86752 RepID=UPI002657B8DB|nr:protein NUCLEAR FUSION DEFECTIVE 4-like [Magnolia sinica]XP_058067442.1 protein NUCLEAR FUSION DEFECTIVE 4-like [Magnolia sinica]